MKKIVKLDIDGVLRNMLTSMVEVYNKEFDENMTELDVSTYDISQAFPKLGKDAFDFLFVQHAEETLVKAEVYPGVAEAVKRLCEHCTVVIVSYQPSLDAKIKTMQWLYNHDIEVDAVVFTSDPSKSILKADYIIDDCVDYLKEVPGEYQLCVKQPYNFLYRPVHGKIVNNLIDAVDHIIERETL